MKRNWKSWIAGGMVLTLLAGIVAVPSFAMTGRRAANLDYHNMKVTLDGQTLTLTDGSGNTVEPFTIDGTTYLPLAAIGRALDSLLDGVAGGELPNDRDALLAWLRW